MGGAWPRRLGASTLAAALLVALALGASAQAAPLTKPCPRPHDRFGRPRDDSRCMGVSVPLDRTGALPGTIRLRVRIAPPLAGSAEETILALAGGPGQAGASLLDSFRFALPGSALRSRRIVTFDQRGTGRSGRLRCPELASVPNGLLGPGDVLQRAVAACATRLGPARAHYATADSVEDIEAVRSALGVDKLVLYGTSYGTKVALDYAAGHPDHVSRLLLDSVVPPEGVDAFERSTLAAIPTVMRALCSDDPCPFTHDAAADITTLERRLARGPLRGPLVDGRGRTRRASLTLRGLYPMLLIGDGLAFQRALVPGAVRAALDGDPALLLRLTAVPFGSFDAQGPDSDALYLATRCEDGLVPWAVGTPVADRAAATDATLAAIPAEQLAQFRAEDVRAFGSARLCNAWPEAPIEQPRPSLPNVPTLILSGDEDLRTPRSDALAVAARIPEAHVLGVSQTGHSVLGSDPGDCAAKAVAAFLAGRPVSDCTGRSSDSEYAPVDPPSRSLRTLRPVGSVPPRAGRTLAAVGETMSVLGRQFFLELLPRAFSLGRHAKAIRLGGLRGGSITVTSRAILLRRYIVVPGVSLSATSDDSDAPLLVHVGGRAAAHGRLRMGEHWIVGRLGGRRVRVRTSLVERDDDVLFDAAGAAAVDAPKLPRMSELPVPLRKLLSWG
jgi:pimeloyl-ACP methyl ester carboxylesterase